MNVPERGKHNSAEVRSSRNTADVGRGRDLGEQRIRQVLKSKGEGAFDYWQSRGRQRFQRELIQDGADPRKVERLLERIDSELSSAFLDRLLAEMIARDRHSEGVESTRGKLGKAEEPTGQDRGPSEDLHPR